MDPRKPIAIIPADLSEADLSESATHPCEVTPAARRRLGVDNELPVHLDQLAHDVIGAAIQVHRRLGPGFLEATYQSALFVELDFMGIDVQRRVELVIDYRGHRLPASYVDILVGGELVVELKAVEAILPLHRAQVRSYLRAGGFQLGLLINFNSDILRKGLHRIIQTAPRSFP